MAGLVLDVVKCFNVLPRALLFAVLSKLGFDPAALRGWEAQLKDMERTLLVGTSVFGGSTSSTGIPEGDPMSIIGMWAMSLTFSHYVVKHTPVLPLCFADNWEVIAEPSHELTHALPSVQDFLCLCSLPVSASKCWLCAIAATDRKALRNCSFHGGILPVKLQAKELGVDIAYS